MSLVGKALHLLLSRVLLIVLVSTLGSINVLLLIIHCLEVHRVLRLVNELGISSERLCSSMYRLSSLGLVRICARFSRLLRSLSGSSR